jgi:hypothetical protein
MPMTNPRHDLSVIKADDQLHLHRHLASQPFHDADDVRILTTRRHEIEQAHSAAFGFNFCFEDQRVGTVAASRCFNLSLWEKPPMSISRVAQKRRKTGG